MTNRSGETDTDLLAGVDLRAFWETLRLRWWVVPATVALAVGFLWAQESDLRTEPAAYLVYRTYEARDPTAVLASVGIDSSAVRSFPDVNNQVLKLQSEGVRREIAEKIGSDTEVTVTRSRPTFTLIDTLESDGESSFVFQSSGVPTYAFSCRERTIAACDEAIEAYATKAAEMRRDGFAGGLADLEAVLEAANEASPDPAIDAKLAALRTIGGRLEVPLTLVEAVDETVGPTVVGVRRPTYAIGVAAGLLVAFLVLLQLAFTDSRIRSVRQVVRLVGDADFLGGVDARPNEVSERRAAVSLHRAASRSASARLRFLPLRSAPSDPGALDRLAAQCGLPAVVSSPFSTMSVPELTADSTDESDVLVVRRNHDHRRELVEACTAMRRSGRPFAGVVLLG